MGTSHCTLLPRVSLTYQNQMLIPAAGPGPAATTGEASLFGPWQVHVDACLTADCDSPAPVSSLALLDSVHWAECEKGSKDTEVSTGGGD